jgi:hypothetical protein
MKRKFTVGQIAQALRCHEQTARQYLHEVNASIDRRTSNLAEAIDQQTLIDLCRRHADSVTGRRLTPLLVPAQHRR